MKKIIYLISLIPVLALGQSQDQNYIKTTTYKTETSSILSSPALNQASQSITYFDGLGRPIQQVAKGQSAAGKNIITPMEYDAYGRQAKEYLPYASQSTGLNYETGALTEVLNYPAYQGQNPWSEKFFEPSPLNRILKQSAPGNATTWAMGSGKEIKLDYQANGADEVKLFKATAAWNAASGVYDISLTHSGTAFYAPNQLYKSVTKDENWTSGNNNTVLEFKDKEGRVILKRTYNGTAHDTYYVYDQYGNLTYVIPPLATDAATQLNGLCYQYKYDSRNRLAEKKLPGKQWEFIVYDKLDRAVATGPAYSPFSDFTAPNNVGWLITKYDAFNRVAYTGWMPSATVTSAGRKQLQDDRNGQTSNFSETKIPNATNSTVNGIDFRYTNVAWPIAGYHVLSVNYYDDYSYPNAPTAFDPVEGQPVYYSGTIKPKGLPTGTWTRVLETSALNAGELSYSLYDSKSRAVRSKTINHLGGHTIVDSKLDFSGKVLYSITRHARTASSSEIYTKDTYTYSDQDRPLVHTHQIGESGIPQLLAKNEYDELGQLIVKRVGGTDLAGNMPLQKVDYAYNIRGWLKEINKTGNLVQAGDPTDLFAFKINYDTVENALGDEIKPLYNGNISETFWKTDSDSQLRSYGYKYDPLNRLTKSVYQKNGLATNAYNEEIRYDMNGNIQGLFRNGGMDSQTAPQEIDDLQYHYDSYNGNRLVQVFDATNSPLGFDDDSEGDHDPDLDYAYDDNGNMASDQNKGITQIIYNHLNLPAKIIFGSETRKIEYIYNAAGVKVQKIVTDDGDVVSFGYLQGYQYKGKTLLFFPTAEGYVNYTDSSTGESRGSFNYVFNYTDHLGNIRLSYGIDPATGVLKIIEENHYYPFGLKHANYNMDWNLYERKGDGNVELRPGRPTAPLEYKYKFQGQEWQDELELNIYFFKYRMSDPAIGRFLQIDPLSDGYVYNSPYAFAENKVVANFELEGLEAKLAIYGEGASANYTSKDKTSFRSRANNLGHDGYTVGKVSNGQQLLSALKTATAQEGSIQKAVIFGHGGSNGLYVNDDDGFYRNSASENGPNRALVSDLVAAINNGSIKFEKNATLIFGMCNACNNEYSGTSIAEQITELTGITTIGSTGYVSQEHSADGNSETNNIITKGTFIKTEKVFDLIIQNPVTGQKMSTLTFNTKEEAQKYKANSSSQIISRIQKTNLGNKINPNDY